MSLSNEEYQRRYGALNRRNSRARQRAYRELAKRHPLEFSVLLAAEHASVGDVGTRGRPRKEASA